MTARAPNDAAIAALPPPNRAAAAATQCRWLWLIATTAALTGCGLQSPAALRPPSTTPTALAELRPPVDVVDAQTDPLVRRAVDYTLAQATWSPDTYILQKARLAQHATASARAQLAAPAGSTPADVAAQLKAPGSSSRAALIGTDGPNRGHEVIVAYKTTATGTGRPPGRAVYAIAHVTLTRVRGRWLVSTFAIQP